MNHRQTRGRASALKECLLCCLFFVWEIHILIGLLMTWLVRAVVVVVVVVVVATIADLACPAHGIVHLSFTISIATAHSINTSYDQKVHTSFISIR
jgi:hypothetical protein